MKPTLVKTRRPGYAHAFIVKLGEWGVGTIYFDSGTSMPGSTRRGAWRIEANAPVTGEPDLFSPIPFYPDPRQNNLNVASKDEAIAILWSTRQWSDADWAKYGQGRKLAEEAKALKEIKNRLNSATRDYQATRDKLVVDQTKLDMAEAMAAVATALGLIANAEQRNADAKEALGAPAVIRD